MIHQIGSYSVLFYGSPAGYQNNRAQIQLTGTDGQVKGWVRFHDEGQIFPNDTVSGGRIVMNLPSARFGDVIDFLRNEDNIRYYYAVGRGFLGTGNEPVGEGEDLPTA